MIKVGLTKFSIKVLWGNVGEPIPVRIARRGGAQFFWPMVFTQRGFIMSARIARCVRNRIEKEKRA